MRVLKHDSSCHGIPISFSHTIVCVFRVFDSFLYSLVADGVYGGVVAICSMWDCYVLLWSANTWHGFSLIYFAVLFKRWHMRFGGQALDIGVLISVCWLDVVWQCKISMCCVVMIEIYVGRCMIFRWRMFACIMCGMRGVCLWYVYVVWIVRICVSFLYVVVVCMLCVVCCVCACEAPIAQW